MQRLPSLSPHERRSSRRGPTPEWDDEQGSSSTAAKSDDQPEPERRQQEEEEGSEHRIAEEIRDESGGSESDGEGEGNLRRFLAEVRCNATQTPLTSHLPA